MLEPLLWIAFFIAGYLIIFFSADVFIDNLRDLCVIYNVSPFVIGLIVLGIDPEESTASIVAAINDLPYIAVGNVIGNSIIALSLCFAIPAFFHEINLKSISRFYFLIIYASLIAIFLSFFIPLGLFIAGFVVLILFLIYFVKSIKNISEKGSAETFKIEVVVHKIEKKNQNKKGLKLKKIVFACISLLFIFLGGELLIISTEQIINLTHIPETFFGFIIIAFVTNVEELTLILKSIKKGSVEIGLGGMIGKLIWNLSVTYGISGIIAMNIEFNWLLIFNWLILLFIMIFYQQMVKMQILTRKGALFLTGILIVFLIINFLPLL